MFQIIAGFIRDMWAKNKGAIVILLLLAVIAWGVPYLTKRSDNALNANTLLLQQQINDEAARIKYWKYMYDSVVVRINLIQYQYQYETHMRDSTELQRMKIQNAAIEAANEKYREALDKTKASINNINNKL